MAALEGIADRADAFAGHKVFAADVDVQPYRVSRKDGLRYEIARVVADQRGVDAVRIGRDRVRIGEPSAQLVAAARRLALRKGI